MDKENFKAYLAWATICIVWGTTYLAIRVGVQNMPPMLFAGFRWLASASFFIPILLIKGYKFPKVKDWLSLSIVGILLLGIANGMVVVAEQWIPSGLAALIITTMPFWVVLIEAVLPQGIRPNIFIVSGLLLGFGGVALIFHNDFSKIIEPSYFLGYAALFLAVTSWAGGSVYSKYKKVDTHPLMGAAFQMMVAGLAQITVGAMIGEFSSFGFNNSESVFAFLYLMIFGSIFGYASYIYAISHLPVSFVTTYAYVNPVIAIFLGWLILDEDMNWIIVIAAVIILAGVFLVKKGSIIQRKIPLNP
ncbi:MAG: EamA family transporter [Bacteroidetes bacterium]|nr:EamA family transporter [Bacteroidota bacterium]